MSGPLATASWIVVDDPGDPRIADFLGLRDHQLRMRREADGGDLAGLFVAEGDLVVERALRAGYRLRSALIDAKRTAPLPFAVPTDATTYAAGDAVLERITGMGVHRGILATFARRPLPSAADVVRSATNIVVCENINNPTNLGVILRSAAGLGLHAALLDPSTCDPLYRRASRVAMGEVFAFPYARTDRLPAGLDVLRAEGFLTVALTPEPTAAAIDQLPRLSAGRRVALLLGAEGAGLSAATLDAVDLRVRIPMHAGVDSLNVGAAAAIACYALASG